MDETKIKQYQNDPDQFAEVKKNHLTQSIFLMAVFLPAFMFIQYQADQLKKSTIEPKVEPSQFILIGVGVLVFYTFLLFKGLGQLEIQFNSLDLKTSETEITLEQNRQKFQLIHISEINTISVYDDKTVVINDNNKNKIIVSKHLKDHDKFLTDITSSRHQIQHKNTPVPEKYRIIFLLAFSGSMLFMLYTFLLTEQKNLILLGLSLFQLVCTLALVESIRGRDRSYKSYLPIILYAFLILIFGITGWTGVLNMK